MTWRLLVEGERSMICRGGDEASGVYERRRDWSMTGRLELELELMARTGEARPRRGEERRMPSSTDSRRRRVAVVLRGSLTLMGFPISLSTTA